MVRDNAVLFYNLESELVRAGISKPALAAMIKISVSALYAKMNGSRPFKLNECERIRKYLEIATDRKFSLDYLFESH